MDHERVREQERRGWRPADRRQALAIVERDELAVVAGWVGSMLAAGLLMLLGNGW